MLYKYINPLTHHFFPTATAGKRAGLLLALHFTRLKQNGSQKVANQATPSLTYCNKFSASNYHEVWQHIFTSKRSIVSHSCTTPWYFWFVFLVGTSCCYKQTIPKIFSSILGKLPWILATTNYYKYIFQSRKSLTQNFDKSLS